MECIVSPNLAGKEQSTQGDATGEDIKDILTKIIAGGELGLQSNNLEDFAKPTLSDRKGSRRFRRRRSKRTFKSKSVVDESVGSAKDLPVNSNGVTWNKSGASTGAQQASVVGQTAPTGAQCNSGYSTTNHQLMDRPACSMLPVTAMEVDFELLHSRAMILPGSRDGRDAPILEISGHNPVWTEPQFSLQDLSNVLGYLHSIPREEVRNRGLSVAVDARQAHKSAVEIITEAFQILEEARPSAVSHVYVLINNDSVFSRIVHSPIFKPRVSYKLEFVGSLDKLYQHLPSSELTETFNGSFVYDHETWIRFRMKLEPFVSGCRSAARYLLASLDEFTTRGGGAMVAGGGDPQGVQEIGLTMDQVQKKHRDIYEDKRLSGLHKEGAVILKHLAEEEGPHAHTEDFKDAIACVSALFNQVHEACTRLDDMAEKRIAHLNQRLQIAAFEEESSKVTKWLICEGEPHLGDMKEKTADSLSAIIAIQKDFEKFYFKAMKYIGRGEDLIEDAHILSESSDEESTAIKEVAKDLRLQLNTFTESLEDKRNYIEDAFRLYTMLDKAYEWALNGMKFVAVLGPEEQSSRERCRMQLCTLEKYMRDDPPVSDDHFIRMQELASSLDQDGCLQQSQFAQKRCQETQNLLYDKMDQLKTLLVGRRRASNPPELRSRPVRTSVSDIDRTCLVKYDKVDETVLSTPKPELLRRVHSNSDPKPHRDSLYSNGSVDSGISVGDKTPSSTISNSSSETVTPKQRRPVATIRPISELVNNEKRTASLERLDEGYEENEQNTESDVKKTSSSSIQRRTHVSRRRASDGGHRASRTEMPRTGNDEEFTLSDEEGDAQVEEWSPLDANRHIRRSMCLEPGQPIKLPVNTKATNHPGYRKMILLMDEMIQTEQDYCLALKYIIDNYYPEMDREDIPQGLRGQRSAVFGNLEKIYEFHDRYFLQELKQCQSTPLQVCHSFLKHKKDFRLYALYNKNKPRSDSLLEDYGSFFRNKQKNLSDNMDVASYLLKPVQRLGKYSLLIRDLIRECKTSDPELALLKAAEEMVQFQMRHGNDLLAMDSLRECDNIEEEFKRVGLKREDAQNRARWSENVCSKSVVNPTTNVIGDKPGSKLVYYYYYMRNIEKVNLFEQGDLLRQDEFLVYRGKRKCLRHVFLFEDLIIFSKTRRTARGHDIYQYKFSLKMTDIGMTESIGESGLKFELWFRRRKSNDKSYTLHCKNVQVKKEWTSQVSKLLWQQAIKSKEARQAELSSMGVGNKPCIDIKPSSDRINDRAIKITTREPRDRNSIAVSSITADQLVRSSYSTSPRAPRPFSANLSQRALLGTLNFTNSNNLIEVTEEYSKEELSKLPIRAMDNASSSGDSRHSDDFSLGRRTQSHGSLNSTDDEKPTKVDENAV